MYICVGLSKLYMPESISPLSPVPIASPFDYRVLEYLSKKRNIIPKYFHHLQLLFPLSRYYAKNSDDRNAPNASLWEANQSGVLNWTHYGFPIRPSKAKEVEREAV